MLGYLYGKIFGLKIVWANRKEGDPVNLLPIGSGYFRVKPFTLINTPTFLNLVILHLPAYEDGTECSETSAYKIQTPGNYPEESIQLSEHGECLKSRKLKTCFVFSNEMYCIIYTNKYIIINT